jgi:hypothetical protein
MFSVTETSAKQIGTQGKSRNGGLFEAARFQFAMSVVSKSSHGVLKSIQGT